MVSVGLWMTELFLPSMDCFVGMVFIASLVVWCLECVLVIWCICKCGAGGLAEQC